MKLMEASNAFKSMNQKLKETHSILNAGDQFAADDSRAEFLAGGNSDGVIWAMPIAHLIRVPLQYAEEVDALVAQFLAEKRKPAAVIVEDEPKEETPAVEEVKEEVVAEKPKKKSTTKKATTKKATGTKKKSTKKVEEVKE